MAKAKPLPKHLLAVQKNAAARAPSPPMQRPVSSEGRVEINVAVPPWIRTAMRDLAHETGVPLRQLAEEALRAVLQRHGKLDGAEPPAWLADPKAAHGGRNRA